MSCSTIESGRSTADSCAGRLNSASVEASVTPWLRRRAEPPSQRPTRGSPHPNASRPDGSAGLAQVAAAGSQGTNGCCRTRTPFEPAAFGARGYGACRGTSGGRGRSGRRTRFCPSGRRDRSCPSGRRAPSCRSAPPGRSFRSAPQVRCSPHSRLARPVPRSRSARLAASARCCPGFLAGRFWPGGARACGKAAFGLKAACRTAAAAPQHILTVRVPGQVWDAA